MANSSNVNILLQSADFGTQGQFDNYGNNHDIILQKTLASANRQGDDQDGIAKGGRAELGNCCQTEQGRKCEHVNIDAHLCRPWLRHLQIMEIVRDKKEE